MCQRIEIVAIAHSSESVQNMLIDTEETTPTNYTQNSRGNDFF
jgi:hypothetical protein